VLDELAPALPSVNAPVAVTRRNPGIMFAILMPTSGPSNWWIHGFSMSMLLYPSRNELTEFDPSR
jgi:hypothetical protein